MIVLAITLINTINANDCVRLRQRNCCVNCRIRHYFNEEPLHFNQLHLVSNLIDCHFKMGRIKEAERHSRMSVYLLGNFHFHFHANVFKYFFVFFFSTFDFRALCVRVWEGDCERYAKNWDWKKKQLLFTCKSQWALKWAFSFPRRFFNICHVIDLFEPIWMYWKFVEMIQLAIADRDTHTHNAKTITGSAYLW